MEDPFRRAAAEFVGTFALVFIGAGSIITAGAIGDPSPVLGVALAHGVTIAVMVSAVGHISGGHFNPAITIGFLITRRIAPLLGVIYVVTQLAAAAGAALLLAFIYPGDDPQLGEPQLNEQVGVASGFVTEALLTFFLVFVVFATAVDPRGTFKSIAGLAIGLTITVDILMGAPLTGAAMNPARAFGPQLVTGNWADAWLWYAAPVVGGAVAAVLYEFLYLRPLAPYPVGPPETGVEEPRPGDTALS